MICLKIINIKFQRCVLYWKLSKFYSTVLIFVLFYTVTCVTLPLSQNLQLGYVHSLHKRHNFPLNKLRVGMVNGNNKDDSERSIIENEEDLYFHPDTILFHPNDRKTDSFKINANNHTYISFNESSIITATKKYPIKPIKLNSIKLPQPNYHPKIAPHVLSKTVWPVDFMSRKIFIRDEKQINAQ